MAIEQAACQYKMQCFCNSLWKTPPERDCQCLWEIAEKKGVLQKSFLINRKRSTKLRQMVISERNVSERRAERPESFGQLYGEVRIYRDAGKSGCIGAIIWLPMSHDVAGASVDRTGVLIAGITMMS
jgi:hypothetical protein